MGDGQVSEEEFDNLISAAAALPKKFGFDWWPGNSKDQFKAIDENGDGFIADCKEALNTGSETYRKVYWFCWKAFQAADADRDGQVTCSEFATMINVATYSQKKLGLPAPYQTQEERDSCFKAMDTNGDGSISFNEWLSFYITDILAKTAAL